MKNFLTLFLLSLTFSTFSQTIKLDYIAKNVIIKFNFQNFTFYTDTNAIFSIQDYKYYPEELDNQYKYKIRNLIYNSIKGDTLTFTGSFIPFNGDLQEESEKYWRVWLTISQLIIENKVIIVNSKGELVKLIKIKNKREKENCFTGKVFFDPERKEELFMYKYRYACTGYLMTY